MPYNSFNKIINNFNGHILNLNLDTLLNECLMVKKVPFSCKPKINILEKDKSNLSCRWVNSENKVIIWHPHGSTKVYDTIRLGYREYGIHAYAYHIVFNEFKAWEKIILSKIKPLSTNKYHILVEELEKLDSVSYESKIIP